MSIDNSGPSPRRGLLKSTAILSAGTLLSRVLGFLRDIILARIFGTGFQADAFFVALRIPNLFRDLVGEGATNSALVPVLTEYEVKNDRAAFAKFVSVVLAWGLVILSALTLLGLLVTPWIVRVMAPGFAEDQAKLDLTIRLTRILFPYLILIGLTAHSMAVLYTRRQFWAPAFSPCLLNVAMIAGGLWSARYCSQPVYGLAVSVLVGGILQLALQTGSMRAGGLRFRWPGNFNHPGAVKIGRLLLPRLVGAGVYQLNVLIDTFCASLSTIVGAGGVSAIYYANRVIQFPMGIFGFAMASAVLPTLSRQAAAGDMIELRRTVNFALGNISFVMLPTSVFLIVLADPVVRLLFARGAFDQYSVQITVSSLIFFTLGLWGFSGTKILVTAFYALQDTKTPVKVAAVCLAVNFILNWVLMFPLKIGGIALASAIAGTLDLMILYYFLARRIPGLNDGIGMMLGKMLVAALVSGVGVGTLWRIIPVPEWPRLVLTGAAGYAFYYAATYALAVPQARQVSNLFKRGRLNR